MTFTQFDAPGFLTDLSGPDLAAWSDWVSEEFDSARNDDGTSQGLSYYGPRMQFFNPLKQPPAADALEKDITWSAFPRLVQISSTSDRQRWETADGDRDKQDEYCEWSVDRDPKSGKIVRVMFTSEGPEYWDFLAKRAPKTVVSLYQQHISPSVKESDLFDATGAYLRDNRWNNSTTSGAMHLIQKNNNLEAEIELAAAATIVRLRNAQPLTSEQELIDCGKYGNAERNSDPHIGAEVNALARGKNDIALANPVGLYLAGLSVQSWQTPDGSPAHDYWKITRGTVNKAVRAVYEVPASKNFVVGDIKIHGKSIEFGAQLVDFITIKLTGLATRLGLSTVQPFNGCVPETPATSAGTLKAAAQRARRSRR